MSNKNRHQIQLVKKKPIKYITIPLFSVLLCVTDFAPLEERHIALIVISAVIREFALLYAAFHETFGELRMSASPAKMSYIQTP